MKKIHSLLLGLLICFAVPASTYAQTQAEMNATAGSELDQADKKLNLAYEALLDKYSDDSNFCSNLKEAQRAWLKFVDYHMKSVFPLNEGEDPRVEYGSMYPLDFATVKTELLNQRISQLDALLEEG